MQYEMLEAKKFHTGVLFFSGVSVKFEDISPDLQSRAGHVITAAQTSQRHTYSSRQVKITYEKWATLDLTSLLCRWHIIICSCFYNT